MKRTPEQVAKGVKTRAATKASREEDYLKDKENSIMCGFIERQICRVMGYQPPLFSNKNQTVTMKNPESGRKHVISPREVLKALKPIRDGEFKDNPHELCHYLTLKAGQ